MVEGDPDTTPQDPPIGYSSTTLQLENIVRALLDTDNINVDSFFEPMESCPEDFYASDVFELGMSIVDCMKKYSKWWLNEYESLIPGSHRFAPCCCCPEVCPGEYLIQPGERIWELNWVVAKLVAIKENKKYLLRFGWVGVALLHRSIAYGCESSQLMSSSEYQRKLAMPPSCGGFTCGICEWRDWCGCFACFFTP